MASSDRPIDVISTGAMLGAEVRGVDLKNIDAVQFAALKRAWHDHQVILVRGQTLSDHDLITFSRRFGDLDWAPIQETGRRFVEGLPEIYIVSNVTVNGRAHRQPRRRRSRVAYRHVVSRCPAEWRACFTPLKCRAAGGNTSFCSMYAVYEALPGHVEARGLQASRSSTTAPTTAAAICAKASHATDDPRTSPGAVHPLVCTHPDTGRRMLYLGRRRNAYLMGLDLADSEALLDELWDLRRALPEFAWEHVWRVGDLVLWDNRCTMHRRDPFDASSNAGSCTALRSRASAAPV